ncbi:MAG: cytochrome c biogenesis protein CcsA [Planctomycetes bacterium]|nr:cytochrome c biogenesis protein CcsA [Planctomycetota bacterium]
MNRVLPFVVPVLAAAWILSSWIVPSTPENAFGRIPVVHNGRTKPMDTIARTYLRIISNKETLTDEKRGTLPAIEWLLNVQAAPFGDRQERTRKDRVFRLDHPQLRDALGLPAREGFRYSIDEFAPRLGELVEALKSAHERKEKKQPLDAYENQLLEFERHLGFYQRLASLSEPHAIAPSKGQEWSRAARSLSEAAPEAPGSADPAVEIWRNMLHAYASGDAASFTSAVHAHLERLEADFPKEVGKAAFEVRFNSLDLFNKCKWLYFAAFIMGALAWLGWSKPLNQAVWVLLVVILWVHTFALVGRMYMSGRPPVTNLYSSAIFIGWGCAVLGVILERIYKLGIGNIAASVAGFVTLLIAHILSADGDTMEVLQAVLDTQFWLATHVTCITLGYATTYMSGLFGILYIIRGVFTPSLTADVAKSLTRMIYGTICFATFFSFVGTVLGGLWADDSWGRFWGWDPKENGALMIVLWNALLLHARWGGLARDRGIAVLSVLGNIVVSWSWFGVNQLGKGLHAYGFTDGVTIALVVFALSQVAIAGCAFLPRDVWRSKLAPQGAQAADDGDGDA